MSCTVFVVLQRSNGRYLTKVEWSDLVEIAGVTVALAILVVTAASLAVIEIVVLVVVVLSSSCCASSVCVTPSPNFRKHELESNNIKTLTVHK